MTALSNRNFLLYASGQLVSLHGLWIQRIATGWLAWELTASELWVGVVAFTQFFPVVLLGPLFGVWVDRVDRRAASIVTNASSMLIAIALFALTALGWIDIWWLAALSLAQGVVRAGNTPVRLAFVPNLVPRELLQSAVAINSIVFNVSRLLGPAAGGVIISTSGVAAAFAVNAASYVAILVALALITLRPVHRPGGPGRGLWRELTDGARYAATHPRIRRLMALILVSALFGQGVIELFPAFADAVFARGSTGLAILTSATGAGAIVAGLVVSRLGGHRLPRLAPASGAAAGLLIAGFALTESFWVGAALAAVAGLALTLCAVATQTLVQSLVEEDYRGRVLSLWGVMTFGGTAIGSVTIGAVSSTAGLPVTGAVCGLAAACLSVAIAIRGLGTETAGSARA